MTGTTYSFVYDSESATEAFKGIGPRDLVLAVLASSSPSQDWEGCLVYRGTSPSGGGTVCLGTDGPCADQAQRLLIEAFERQGIAVLQVYEGGPGVDEPIAQAESGRWVTP